MSWSAIDMKKTALLMQLKNKNFKSQQYYLPTYGTVSRYDSQATFADKKRMPYPSIQELFNSLPSEIVLYKRTNDNYTIKYKGLSFSSIALDEVLIGLWLNLKERKKI